MANELRTDYIVDIARAPERATRNMLANQQLIQQIKGQRSQNILSQQAVTRGQHDIERYKFKDMQEATAYFLQAKDHITFENYPAFKGYSIARGVPEHLLPDFKTEKEFQAWKMTTAQKIQLETAGLKAGGAKSSLGKMIQDRNALFAKNPNSPDIATYDQAIKNKATAKGVTIKTNADGSFEYTQGPLTTSLGTSATTEVEKRLMNIDDSLSRVDDIITEFKPEYQQLGTRWATLATKWKEKLADTPLKVFMGDVSANEKKLLSEFSTYRKNAVASANEEIKRITGAQMSNQEAKRLIKGLPNPGTGLFDGDSPTEFISALKVTYRNLMKAKARYLYYRNKGYDDSEIKGLFKSNKSMGLNEINTIINERAAQIEADLKARSPELGEDELIQTVREQIAQEFGFGGK